jgi:Flp pilus assembly pilin Flp
MSTSLVPAYHVPASHVPASHVPASHVPATDGPTIAAHVDHEGGQATAEYALVILGAALIAVLLVTWATAGGGAGRIGDLFDAVMDAVLSRVG